MESKKNYKQIGGSDIIPLDWKVQKIWIPHLLEKLNTCGLYSSVRYI